MLHVKQITDIIDEGKTDEAHQALDQLLALGPNNTEALKLRARLYEFEGRFAEESRIWDRIAQVDREDPDAVGYHLRKQLEDREHFYFTDDIPGGGRRFMAYPRRLVNTSALGLLGCIGFLVISRLAGRWPVLAEPSVMLGMFCVLVMGPWLGIISTYFCSIKAIAISAHGITVSTRVRSYEFKWSELEKVCMARSATGKGPQLALVLMPKDAARHPVEIGLDQGSTAIRARSYLIREITRLFSEPEYVRREALGLERRKVSTF